MADLKREYQSWEVIHKHGDGVSCLREFAIVLDNYQTAHADFKSAIYRGEPNLYDSKNTGYDTYLTSKIGRDGIIYNKTFTPYTRHANGKLNLTTEELAEINKFQDDRDYDLAPSSSIWLSLAQHSGAKTRLIDFTSSPLVALFFACWTPRMDDGWVSNDGVVFLVLPNGLRPQTKPRDKVKPGDIEQGCPASFFEIFEPWSLSPVHSNVGH